MDPATAATLALAADKGLQKLIDGFKAYREGKGAVSLTNFINQANIMGRVYIEDSVAQDDIAIPLMGVLNQFYVSWIITALGIDSMCADGRTVRQRLELVASEALETGDIDKLVEGFGLNDKKPLPSTEAKVIDVDTDTQRLVCGRLIELDFDMGIVETGTQTSTGNTKETESNVYDDHGDKISGNKNSTSNQTRNTTTIKSSRSGLLKAYMYVQLVPYILPKQTCEGFLSLNFVQGLISRWKAVRAGEISFIKDFIFARDLIDKQDKMLKSDKTGTLAEMQWRQQNRIFNFILRWRGIRPETHNLSNSFIVVNKQTFDQACREAHVDFNSQLAREKFFLKTFSMGLVVVDPMYGNVKMYFAGVSSVGTYTYTMINKVGAKGKDNFDLKEIMNAFASGQSPKF